MIIFVSILYCCFLLLAVNALAYNFWIAIILSAVVLFGIIKIIGKSTFLLIAPLILAAVSFLLASFLAPKTWAYGFIVISLIIFIASLYLRKSIVPQDGSDDRRKHLILRKSIMLNKAIDIIISTISFIALFAALENLNISYPVVLLGFFAVSMLFSKEILKLSNSRNSNFYKIVSFVIGLSILEFAWILSLWPLGFFSLGIILASIFFAFVDIAQQIISKRKTLSIIAYDIGLAVLVILIISLTVKWMPI